MSDRFYVNSPLAPGPLVLQGPEAHHLGAVRRICPGDPICLFNGDGREYLAEVRSCGHRAVTVEILSAESPNRELGYRLEVATPLPKGDRGQFLVEKLTELGVTTFVPLQTRRSIVHAAEGRSSRWERYVIEASKQCGRNVLMQIAPSSSWSSYCRRDDLPRLRILAHPGGAASVDFAGKACALAVGPEGGFDDAEVEEARAAGWQVIGLGDRIMRIETAAIVMAAWAVRDGCR
jgi:16S rRNA (uracil1498-N3)-methyltransferase